MALPEPPDEWEDDALAMLFDRARGNCFATFKTLRPEWDRLVDIHLAFERASDACGTTDDPLPAFFLIRAHSAFLAGARLAAGGQLPESYSCLRLAIEHALHAHYLAGNTESQMRWLSRQEDDSTRRIAMQEFRPRKMLDHLEAVDAGIAARATELYERTIDMGAHPNERAITSNLTINLEGEAIEFTNVLLADQGPALKMALKACGRVGLCSLDILSIVFAEQFALNGLDAQLDRLRGDL